MCVCGIYSDGELLQSALRPLRKARLQRGNLACHLNEQGLIEHWAMTLPAHAAVLMKQWYRWYPLVHRDNIDIKPRSGGAFFL